MWKIKFICRNEDKQKMDGFLRKTRSDDKNSKTKTLTSEGDICSCKNDNKSKKKSKILPPCHAKNCENNLKRLDENIIKTKSVEVDDDKGIIIIDDDDDFDFKKSESKCADNHTPKSNGFAGEDGKKIEDAVKVEGKYSKIKHKPLVVNKTTRRVKEVSAKVKEATKTISSEHKMQKIDSFLIKNCTNENKNPKKRQISSESDVCDNDSSDLGLRKKRSKILSPSLDQNCDNNSENNTSKNIVDADDENSIIVVDDNSSDVKTSASGSNDNFSAKTTYVGENKEIDVDSEKIEDTVKEKCEIVEAVPIAIEETNNKVIETTHKVKEVPQMISTESKSKKMDSFLIKNCAHEVKKPKKRQLGSESDACVSNNNDVVKRKKKSKNLSLSRENYYDKNVENHTSEKIVEPSKVVANDKNSTVVIDDNRDIKASASGSNDDNFSLKTTCAGEKKMFDIECEKNKDTIKKICEGIADKSLTIAEANTINETTNKLKGTPQIISAESDSLLTEESPNNNNTSVINSLKNVTPKSASKRHLTPKQLLKKQESEKKREAKEQVKMEKERLRKEKEDKINQLKEERKRLKIEKTEMKKREKEEKEKKKQIEIELKSEEKRTKEEEKKAKEEEKRKREEAKEEERRKRDEAKEEERRKKEAEKRKEEKAATTFASFFTPKRSDNKSALLTSAEDVTDSPMKITKFMPFEVKADMRVATIQRRTLELEDKMAFDIAMKNQNCDANDLYIGKLKSKQHTPLSDDKTWSLQDYADDVIIIESEVAEEDKNEEENKSNREKKRVQRPRAKLLQFHENQRPPYWGTWRKTSSIIGPRKPIGQDKAMFEYDIDSDDEWEEEEPGESLHGSDDEKESEDEYEVDNQVFVPHGYLSDEEAQDEMEDMSPKAQKAKLKFLEKEFEAEMKEKTEKLKPRLIGCVWFNNNIEDHVSVGSYIAELLLSRRAVLWDNVTVPIHVDPSGSLSSSPVNTPAKSEQNKIAKSNAFPESAIPSLIKLVHGNRFKHKFLVEEFYNHVSQNSNSILEVPSKKAISKKMREIAEWMVYPQEENSNHPMIGRKCWFITKEVRDEHGMLDQTSNEGDAWLYSLEVPRNISSTPSAVEQSSPVTLITKFTKVLSQEERKKQLKNQEKQLTGQLASSSSSSEKEKEASVNSISNEKCVKNRQGKRVRVNVMDAFIKAKAKKEKDNSAFSVVDIIELSQ